MKYWILAIFLICTDMAVARKGQIFGKLKLDNGAAVSFATIYIPEVNKSAMADDDGKYAIADIPYGKYTLEISSIEIERETIEIDVEKESTEYSFTLKANEALNLDEVVVYGNTEVREIKRQGFAVNLIDTKTAGLQSTQSLELLNRTAGIKIRESGGMGSQTNFMINGLAGNSVRVFIDGIPIRNYGESFSLSSIPPVLIERIEVYKGVLPGHLSEDALGGGINVILKKTAKNGLSTSYSFGSFNTHQWNMNGSYRNSRTGFTVSGSAFLNYTDNSYKVWGNEVYVSDESGKITRGITARRFHDGYKSYGVKGQFGFTDVKWADLFLIGVQFSDMEKDIQNGSTMEIVYGNRASSQDTRMANLQYEKTDLLKGLDVRLFASFSNANRTVVDTIPYKYNWYGQISKFVDGSDVQWVKGGGEAGPKTHAENKERNLSGRANAAYRFTENHKISVNMLYDRFTRDVDDPMQPSVLRELTDTRYLTKDIISVTYESKFFDDKLKTSLFYKYYYQKVKLKDPKKEGNSYVADVYDRSIDSNGYGATIAYALRSNILFMISAEKAYRLPGGSELLGNTTENINPTYDLKPEHSTNFNIGVNLGDFHLRRDHRFNMDVNFFYRDIKDMIVRGETTATDDFYSYENLGQIVSKGIDFELKYGYREKLNVLMNMSSINARYNLEFAPNGQRYIYYKDRLRNSPYFTASGSVEYRLKDIILKDSHLSLNYHLGYVHKFFRNWESLGGSGKAMIPSQMVHDVGFTYTFPGYRLAISFDAKNIGNEQVFDNWALQKPGRRFFVKISYRII